MRIEDELLAAEQEAAKELMRKREVLRRARSQRSLEEAAQRVCKEEVQKVQEVQEEAEHQAQEEVQKAWEVQEAWEAWEVARCRVLEENEMNTHPEEDGDYVPDDTMDVDDGTVTASPGKKKKKERVLVERTGDVRCKECMSHKATCLVEEARVKKWKQLAAEGMVLTHTPPSVVCTECASRKHTCFLPELEKEQAITKSASK